MFSSHSKLRLSQSWSTQGRHLYSIHMCPLIPQQPDIHFYYTRYQPTFTCWFLLAPSLIFMLHLSFLLYSSSHHLKIHLLLHQQPMLTSNNIHKILILPTLIIFPITPHPSLILSTPIQPLHKLSLFSCLTHTIIFYPNNSNSFQPRSEFITHRIHNISPNPHKFTHKSFPNLFSAHPLPSPANTCHLHTYLQPSHFQTHQSPCLLSSNLINLHTIHDILQIPSSSPHHHIHILTQKYSTLNPPPPASKIATSPTSYSHLIYLHPFTANPPRSPSLHDSTVPYYTVSNQSTPILVKFHIPHLLDLTSTPHP